MEGYLMALEGSDVHPHTPLGLLHIWLQPSLPYSCIWRPDPRGASVRGSGRCVNDVFAAGTRRSPPKELRRAGFIPHGGKGGGTHLNSQLMSESPARQSNALDRGDGLR